MTRGISKNRLGDREYRIEWTSEIFIDENGDMDIDRNKQSIKTFPADQYEQAKKFAEEIYVKEAVYTNKSKTMFSTMSVGGVVSLRLFEFVPFDDEDRSPHVGFWTEIGFTEHYSGEWEK